MPALSCADLMAEAENEYASLPLSTRQGATVRLRSLLMLAPEGLASARVLLGAFGDGDSTDVEELVPKIRDLLLLVADDPAALKAEVADWPLGVFVRVIGEWQEKTQAGEAPRSDS
ncbi:phage tail assembly protein [Streptomyces sioyaensis]|uniref:phage tail assembly protein n=1 Tax=Streptomyces sioyaensis TaxID=67364 RepID=UPI0037D255D1